MSLFFIVFCLTILGQVGVEIAKMGEGHLDRFALSVSKRLFSYH